MKHICLISLLTLAAALGGTTIAQGLSGQPPGPPFGREPQALQALANDETQYNNETQACQAASQPDCQHVDPQLLANIGQLQRDFIHHWIRGDDPTAPSPSAAWGHFARR